MIVLIRSQSTSTDHGIPMNTGDEFTELGPLGYPRPYYYHSLELLVKPQCLQRSSPSSWHARPSRPPNKSTHLNAADSNYLRVRDNNKTLEDRVSAKFAKADWSSFVWLMHGADTRTWITVLCNSRPSNRGTRRSCHSMKENSVALVSYPPTK